MNQSLLWIALLILLKKKGQLSAHELALCIGLVLFGNCIAESFLNALCGCSRSNFNSCGCNSSGCC